MDLLEIRDTAIKTFLGTLPSARTAAKIAGGAFVALGAALYFGQTYIIYPSYAPSGSRTEVPTPDKHGMPHYEDLTLDTPDGLKIKAYMILQGAGEGKEGMREQAVKRPTILFLHANAGNMGHRLPFAHIFYEKLKCNVFMLSYRGYGKSEGKANEKGIRNDAQLALDYVTSHPLLEKTKVVLYGQSIGGAVAADLAARNPDRIAGLIIENTFLNLSKIAREAMPIATPYILLGLLTERWDAAKQVAKIKRSTPALFLSGSQDELVPPYQLLELFKLCSSEKKRLRQFPNGAHNDTCVQPGYWTEIQKWLHDEIAELPQGVSTTLTSQQQQEQKTTLARNSEEEKLERAGTYDERRMDGAEKELEGSMGAGSIAP